MISKAELVTLKKIYKYISDMRAPLELQNELSYMVGKYSLVHENLKKSITFDSLMALKESGLSNHKIAVKLGVSLSYVEGRLRTARMLGQI